jgi:phage-related protein
MGYLSFRGVSTQNLTDVYVQTMPSHKKAAKRMTEYRVKGRDGVLHVDEGFDNMDIPVRLVLINAGAEARQLVNAWADGTGKLITSDDLSKAYKATVIDEIIWNRDEAATVAPPAFSTTEAYYVGDFVTYAGMVYKFTTNHAAGEWNASHVVAQPWKIDGLYDTAEITFNCEPFMYESVDTVIALTQTGSITNPGSAAAFPLIKVECTADGDVSMTIAGYDISIESMVTTDPVYIDCANGYIYSASGSAKTMTGNIPYFDVGANAIPITFGTNLKKLTITPHWRWV